MSLWRRKNIILYYIPKYICLQSMIISEHYSVPLAHLGTVPMIFNNHDVVFTAILSHTTGWRQPANLSSISTFNLILRCLSLLTSTWRSRITHSGCFESRSMYCSHDDDVQSAISQRRRTPFKNEFQRNAEICSLIIMSSACQSTSQFNSLTISHLRHVKEIEGTD